ncbi:MAG: hypothetical protein LAP21_17515 [Acidobacteriia bacterium]|nr:hypothetical protein [Terriglobia bacterium]
MFRLKLWMLVFPCLFAIGSSAQDLTPPAPQRLFVHSKILNEGRVIWVRIPAASRQVKSRYPVLYLTDGDGQINEIGGTIDFLAGENRMPPMIVVGIPNTDRVRDLTPTRADLKEATGTVTPFPSSGGGDKFLDFIQFELFPEIEKRYATEPFRVFAGHSLGGLMAIHALITRPDMFNAYLAVSPSLQWDNARTLHQAEQFFASHHDLKKALFFSLATEQGVMSDAFVELQKTLTAGAPNGFVWDSARYSDEDHSSTVLRAHYAGLRMIFADFRMPRDPKTGRRAGGLAEVEQYYRRLSERYGYPVSSEGAINSLGYSLLSSKQINEAMAAFQRNVELYPESANVYDSLADGYEGAGKLELAKQSLVKCLEVATRNGDPRLPAFQKHLERITTAAGTAPAKASPAK